MKLLFVTGGSRGLGAALCAHYLDSGWEVKEFSRAAPFPFSFHVDFADPAFASQRLMQALAPAAGLEVEEAIAVGNAAMLGPVGPVERSSPAEIAAHYNVNVVSATLFACLFFAVFQENACPKTFVNISSGAGSRGLAGWSLYCASKAAMDNYVRAVALEQEARTYPIRAISVNPGVMDTEMQAEVRSALPDEFPDVEHYVRLHEEGRLGDPKQVAARIAKLIESRPAAGGVYRV